MNTQDLETPRPGNSSEEQEQRRGKGQKCQDFETENRKNNDTTEKQFDIVI